METIFHKYAWRRTPDDEVVIRDTLVPQPHILLLDDGGLHATSFVLALVEVEALNYAELHLMHLVVHPMLHWQSSVSHKTIKPEVAV